jgi:hypothetical protein
MKRDHITMVTLGLVDCFDDHYPRVDGTETLEDEAVLRHMVLLGNGNRWKSDWISKYRFLLNRSSISRVMHVSPYLE